MTEDASYEIVWNAETGRTFVYRNLRAGICGPWTPDTTATDRQQAEAEALRYGIHRAGPWTNMADSYTVAPAQRITP